MNRIYTVFDVIASECTLTPMACLHCGEIGEVIYNQYIGDAICQICGNWQLDEIEEDQEG